MNSLVRVCFAWVLAFVALGATAADPSITGVQLVSSRRLGDFDLIETYKALLANPGGPLVNVTATARSLNAAVVLTDPNVAFGDVAAGATGVASTDTFAIRRPQSQAFRPADLAWTVSGTPASPIWAGFTATPTSGLAPLSVRFTPAPLSDAAIVQFRWDFDGNGSTDVTDTVGRDQTFVYAQPGSYAAALTILDSLGRTDKRTQTIVVGNAPPVASSTASPTNGAAPLSVTFTTTATDANGVVKFEWDFDGNGSIDRVINGTAGTTSFSYATPGSFQPSLRVTDALGAVTTLATPAMAVRVGPAGSPRATLTVSASTGAAPLAVRLTGAVTDPLGQSVQGYEWDANGDGTFEAATGTTNVFDASYASAGTWYPRMRVTMADGRRAEDVKTVKVTSGVSLVIAGDTIDPALGQVSNVNTTLTGTTRVSVVIEPRGQPGTVVRTLVDRALRNPGTYIDPWDGRGADGKPVPEGVYLAVVKYDVDGVQQRYDLSTSTGGVSFSPSRTTISSSFEPYNGQPMVVDITFTRASELTAFIGSFQVDTRYVTFMTRQPLGRGTHRITWYGDSAPGQILTLAPGDSFLFGSFGYTLPDNAIYVRSGAQVSNVVAEPAIFDPTAPTDPAPASTIRFALSAAATAEVEVIDTRTGVAVRRLRVQNVPAGNAAVRWDGKADDGRYVAPGTYRVGVSATQRNGFRSQVAYTLQRVYY